MTERNAFSRFCIPSHLAAFLGRLGAIYHPKTAIDPCCEDVSALAACNYVADRRALFRNPTALKQAERIAPSVQLELNDITRVHLDRQFDLVLTVVPFGAIDYVAGKRNRLDILMAERCLDLVAQNGACLLIVPPSFLTALSLSSFRNRVLDYYSLDAVIELPPRSLWERASVGGALLVIRRGPARRDGTYISSYEVLNSEELFVGIREGVGHFCVSTDNLRGRWDRHFHDPIHHAIEKRIGRFETKRLDELGEIRRGINKVQRASDNREYLVLTPRHLRADSVVLSDKDRYVSSDASDSFARAVVQTGDVLVSLMQPHTYVYQPHDPRAVAGPHVAIIRAKDNEYISTYLNTADGEQLFQAQAERHASSLGGIRHLSISGLREIRIPILPLDDLNAVSDKRIKEAPADELEIMRKEILWLKKKLEAAEAQLEQERRGDFSAHMRFIKQQFALVLEQQQTTNTKLNHIINILTTMSEDVCSIKRSSRDDAEKFTRIYSKLDLWMEEATGQKRTMEKYTLVVRDWLDHWDRLEPLTQTFLPSAEHLYDELERIGADDFSPFVVQYCRSLENEILLKLFSAYHDDLRGRITDIPAFVAWDLAEETPKKQRKSTRFAESVKKDYRKYTLGDMNWVMQLIRPGGSTLAASALLQDFRAFVLRYFEAQIAEKEFLDRVKEINNELRNKAAHPSLVPKEMADKCIKLVRMSLCELINAYRESPTGGKSRHEEERDLIVRPSDILQIKKVKGTRAEENRGTRERGTERLRNSGTRIHVACVSVANTRFRATWRTPRPCFLIASTRRYL
jgi:hypothetical protein